MKKTASLGPDVIWDTISVLLADDRLISEVNEFSFGERVPTDVLCYKYDPLPGGAWNAEIIINTERAGELGDKYGGVNRELALYLAHGCDHLTGASDHTHAAGRRMRARELRWIKEADRLQLLDNLVGDRDKQ